MYCTAHCKYNRMLVRYIPEPNMWIPFCLSCLPKFFPNRNWLVTLFKVWKGEKNKSRESFAVPASSHSALSKTRTETRQGIFLATLSPGQRRFYLPSDWNKADFGYPLTETRQILATGRTHFGYPVTLAMQILGYPVCETEHILATQ